METKLKKESYIDNTGAYRWIKSNNVVPNDILVQANVDASTLKITARERLIEQGKVLKAYIAHRAENGYSREERYEMKAAFGNESVIDVFTGKEIKI